MADINEELAKWFEELQKIPVGSHLLCPRTSDDDDENYKIIEDAESRITADEKRRRIEQGQERIKITYWNSLIFGFDKQYAGKWLDEFSEKLQHFLETCPDCVLNWHMKRKSYLQLFSE